jgi:Beta-L-arabinofuranosidase, GH127
LFYLNLMMIAIVRSFVSFVLVFLVLRLGAQTQSLRNRAPLRADPYLVLPIGAIQPEGWLREMLVRQAKGATGHLDSLYPEVMGVRNGWRGGDGDQWERGPYWLDGLLPLAYILHDPALIAKTKPYIEWTLGSQQSDGYFGPTKDYPEERGLQRNNCRDWWPHMVMLKVLQQYYSATGDKRVIKLMTNYFRYQLARLPVEQLDHWTFWARYRAGDNLQAVYWLYNITGDGFLLDLADVLHRQTFDYTDAFLHTALLSTTGAIHGVNLAEGMKEPLVYYQQHPEKRYVDATDKGLADLQHFDGMAHGLFGGDESLHGSDPTQGSELCTAVEMMYTLEQMICITGNVGYADRLERIAFNALPAQIDSNFIGRQYFQQANQVMVTRHNRNFDFNHDGTDVCYGLFTGYTCCTANMHQGWPKFTQNLWYLTPDDGLAAMVYAPNTVRALVKGKEVVIHEETNYPFGQTIRFRIGLSGGFAFPLRLRIPGWCKGAVVNVNGAAMPLAAGDSVAVLNRVWKEGDVVVLKLPMRLSTQTWHEHAVSVERGPIVYALKIGEAVSTVRDTTGYGSFEEIRPTTHWNYALVDMRSAALQAAFSIKEDTVLTSYPWTVSGAPVVLHARARRLPDWQIYNESAGPQPYSPINNQLIAPEEETITLIPYGCTRLRISEFPVVEK